MDQHAEQCAIEAFKVHATAYLLKPIDKDLLISTVENIEKRKAKNMDGGQIKQLMALLEQSKPSTGKFAIPTMEGVEYIEKKSIIRCLAEGNYTRIYMEEGSEIYISKSLKQVEGILNSNLFVRLHNSHLVNSTKIKKYIKGSGGQVILDDNTSIPVSKGRKSVLENM